MLTTTRNEVEVVRSTILTLVGKLAMGTGLLATRRKNLEQAVGDAPGTTSPDDATKGLTALEAWLGERTRSVGAYEDRLRCDDGERGRVDAMRRQTEDVTAEHAT